MAQKTDLRIIKTKRNIREAFLKLMYAKGFNEMTVNEILDEALINRSTFYAHYRDKYDLREQIENDLLDDFKSHAQQSYHVVKNADRPTGEAMQAYLSSMLEFLKENRRLVSYLLGLDGDPAFSSRLAQKSHELWKETELLPRLSIPENYALAVMSSVFSAILTEWAGTGFEDDDDEVISILSTILTSVSSAIII